jgi:alkylation response protein AidB-like acyl-CoA dehydrogenase
LRVRTSEATILAPGQNLLLIQQAQEFAQVASDAAFRADETGVIGPEVWSALHDCGLAMAPFAPSFGGCGLGSADQQTALCFVLRLIGAADLSVARVFEGHVNAVMLVSRYGTETQIKDLAQSVKNDGLSGVWGAEDANGLHRIRRGSFWALDGRKIFASGADVLTRPLITVGTPDGHVLYLLDLGESDRADTATWRPLGMKASASGTVDLTGLIVGETEQVGSTGDYTQQPFFSGGAWRFCAAQLGAMERLGALYAEHLLSRGREQDPYQLERVAQISVACATTLFWVEEASRRFGDESLEPAAVVAFANLTRMVTERAALDVIERVQRGAGLTAFMHSNPIERISRDLATYLRQPVPDAAMSDAARAVLTGELSIGSIQ